jgi:hypothetical protein
MICWLVSLLVGDVENNDPGLIAPIAAHFREERSEPAMPHEVGA